ncbi:MAG: PIG-L deacetylase family protein [Promethearchaeota archaeon]
MEFYDFQKEIKSTNIELLFPDWKGEKENIVIFSPHDDDAILGAGYCLLCCLENHANIYIIIFHDGSAGYTNIKFKNRIVEIRRKETINAYKVLGISEKNIIRYDLPDFSGIHFLGWKLPWSTKEGLFSKNIENLRRIKATRLILPNGYREHLDHLAVYISAIFDGPQVGDSVIIDYGIPSKIKSYLQYSVWAKFSPENALINQRSPDIRANKAIVVNKKIEEKIIEALKEFKTQEDIISYILEVRKDRKIDANNRFIETYLEIDPRPRFNYTPYIEEIKKIDNYKHKRD